MPGEKVPENTIHLTLNRYCGYDFRFCIFPWSHTSEDDPGKLYYRNFWKIIYIFSGSCRKFIDGESYEVRPNMLLLVHPEERTRFEVPPGEKLELCNVIFAPELIEFGRPLLESHVEFMNFFKPVKPVLNRAQRRRLYMQDAEPVTGNLIRSMLREFEQVKPGYRSIIRLQLVELLCRMARRSERMLRRSNGEMMAKQAADYICEHYRELQNADELAGKFGVSRQYLHRIFSRFYGCSVNRALCRHRLMVACRLLQEAPLRSISEICYAVGFNDLSYSYRKFREEFGCVPGEMRRNAMPAATEEGR